MTEEQWQIGFTKTVGVFLNGKEIPTVGPKGERIIDDDFLLFFNAHYETVEFTLPIGLQDKEWTVKIDTKEPRFITGKQVFTGTQAVPVTARSLVVLSHVG